MTATADLPARVEAARAAVAAHKAAIRHHRAALGLAADRLADLERQCATLGIRLVYHPRGVVRPSQGHSNPTPHRS
jgi:hypothetical protein